MECMHDSTALVGFSAMKRQIIIDPKKNVNNIFAFETFREKKATAVEKDEKNNE